MKLQNKLVEIMKEKQDKFKEDEKLRILAYKRNLARMTRLWEKEEAYNKGIEKERYEKVLKFFQFNYPGVDSNFLEGLSMTLYDEIFDMILMNESLEEIVKKAGE